MQEDVIGKAYDARLMRRLLQYLRPHSGAVAIAFVVILGGSLVELAQPWITQQAIDKLHCDRRRRGAVAHGRAVSRPDSRGLWI